MVIKKLKDCCMIIAGQSPESKYYNTDGIGIPFFQGKADFGEVYPTVRVYCSQPIKVAEKDDILLSVRAPVGPTNLSPGKVCIGRGLTAIRPSEILNIYYLLYFFQFFEEQLKQKGIGTTFKAITQDIIKNLKIPVPPVAEQQQIVTYIEELFSKLDKAVETLQTVKVQLAVYRQAVLKEAFAVVSDEEYQLLGNILETAPQNGIYKPKSEYGSGIQILRIDGFYDGAVVNDYDFKRVRLDEHEADKYKLCVGDLVINRVNSMPYLGKCALIRTLSDVTVFESNIMRMRLNEMVADSEYVTYYLSSCFGRQELIKNAKQAVNQASINQNDVQNARIPVPELDQQMKIKRAIESCLSVCDNIEQTVDTALQQAEAMRKGILRQAFEGKLTNCHSCMR
ncbi:MAG: hypothetical protein HFH87_02960 [Lachnospiraceae bacterium]|nr:hypothetical protein [Lachnospiraceae bacterium]